MNIYYKDIYIGTINREKLVITYFDKEFLTLENAIINILHYINVSIYDSLRIEYMNDVIHYKNIKEAVFEQLQTEISYEAIIRSIIEIVNGKFIEKKLNNSHNIYDIIEQYNIKLPITLYKIRIYELREEKGRTQCKIAKVFNFFELTGYRLLQLMHIYNRNNYYKWINLDDIIEKIKFLL